MNHHLTTDAQSDAIADVRSRTATEPRPEHPSSPRASITSRPRRRLGLVIGAVAALFLLTGCNLPVAQWVPDFNGDGTIDEAEVQQQRDAIIREFVASIEAQRRAVQNHPFLSCVRRHESGGDYAAQNRSSSASGAYQFLDSTWRRTSARAGYGGFAKASHAPWYVQDSVALWLYQNGGRSAWNGTGC